MVLLFAFLIGFFAGLRSLTAPAVVSWAAYLEWLRIARPLSLIGSFPSAMILSLLAVGELVFDKLPNTPSRTSPPGLIARLLTGGVTGACVSMSGGQGALVGAGLGATGGLVGAFAGYQARSRLAKALSTRDLYIALLEDLLAIGGCLWIVSGFSAH
ncbi:MAG TPA: DUF4126 family protein [Pyrinomonadaceae bacterium]|nr:DUF4126 family protein [Pyrinomonadaceae bacterium]